ncbi:hypothetical protein [Lusitaniella coriacea]|uniref:hypothetical protein n=1 Tax=Lusitaniella coriacea TaxID=1983105 RepID=UPI003CF639EF
MSISAKYYPPPIPQKRVAELCKLVMDIEDSPPNSSQATDLIAKFNTETGQNYSEFDFREYYGAVDLATFVREAFIPG